jgi:hypothetical protein
MQRSITTRSGVTRFVIAALVLSCLLAFSVAGPPSARAAGTAEVAPQASTSLFLPMILKADPYADWVSLGRPAGGAPVNFVYVSPTCGSDLPASILAGTDAGLYRFNGSSWTLNSSPGSRISVSHIISTAASGMFLSSYDRGLWHSADGGTTWARETLPFADSDILWLAATNDYIYAAGSQGTYRRSTAGGAWSAIRTTTTYTIAATGGKVYAAEVGDAKDTLFISSDNGTTWPTSRQLPGSINFVQTIDSSQAAPQLLIGTIGGGLFKLDGANNIVAFSQGAGYTVYGIWRDSQGRVYAALETGGGLKRFPQAGGPSDLDLSALPGGGSLTAEELYTVNGSTTCNIVVAGSESGGVWVRRAPTL